MAYSLLDDTDWEDWEREQQENAALGSLLSPELGMPSAPPPMAAYQAPPHAEMAPLNFDTGPDWSDALGVGTTALAALADLGLNKGTGTGQILAAGGQFGQARAQQRLQGTQDALNYEEKRAQLDKSNKYNDYLYANMAQRGANQQTTAQQRARSQDQRDQQLGLNANAESRKQGADARAAENQDPSEFIAWAGKKGYDLSGLQTMAQARAAMAPLMKEWDLEHTGEKSAAQAEGRIGAELDASEALGDAAASKAGKVAEAQTPEMLKRIKAKAEAERDLGSEGGIPGLVETDPAAARASLGDAPTKRNLQKAAGGYQSVMSALQEMADLREKNGTMMLGPEAARYETLKQTVVAGFGDIANSGVLNPTDLERFSKLVPGAGLDAKDLTRLVGVDQKLEDLRGAMQGFGPQLQAKLKPYGMGLEGQAPIRLGGGVSQANGAKPMSGGAVNMAPAQQSGLPRAQPNADGTFSLPGGRRPYTAAEVQQFIQMGKLAPL